MRAVDDPELAEKCRQLTLPGAEIFASSVGAVAEMLVPNEPADIVDWAAANVSLPSAVSSRSGPLELNPLQAAIARLWQTPGVKQVTFRKPPRFGSSLLNAAGLTYFAGHEGVDVIFYERSEGDAQDFHDKKLFPIIENSTALSALKRPDTKYGVQDAWTDRILTNGASIQLRSASNDGSFRAIKGAFICVDEAGSKEYRDRSKNSEGSKISLIRKRAQEFATPMLYVGGTPTKVGECMVSDEYSRSDKREFRMPCRHCGEYFAFVADVRKAKDRQTPYGAGIRYTVDDRGLVDDAWYECACSGQIEETEKIRMMEAGRLEPTDIGEPGHVGVTAWAAYSTDPQSTWRHVAAEHRKAETDPDALQPYVNLVLALPYQPPIVRTTDPSELENRAEDWGDADGPAFGECVFVGIDLQEGNLHRPDRPPRAEIVTYVAGRNRKRAIIDRHIIAHRDLVDQETGEIYRSPVEPMSPACEEMIWEYCDREWTMADGRKLKARRVFVDCGWRNTEVLEFCAKPRSRQLRITAVKGAKETYGRRPVLPAKESLSKRYKRPFLFLGTQSAKDTLARTLKIPTPAPESWTFSKSFDAEFYNSLLAEHEVEKSPGNKRWERISEEETGEVWDCLVYAYAAECWERQNNNAVKELIEKVEAEALDAAIVAQVVDGPSPREASAPIADASKPATPEPTPSRFRIVRGGTTKASSSDEEKLIASSRRPKRAEPRPRMPGVW